MSATLFHCWAVFAVLSQVAAAGLSQQQGDFVALGKSFNIKTVITKSNSNEVRTTTVQEFYSASQKRSRLHLAFGLTEDVVEEVYYDANTQIGVTRHANDCNKLDLDALMNELYHDAKKPIDDLISSLNVHDDPYYVIGPAKLLFILSHYADKMTGSINYPLRFKNRLTEKYELKLKLAGREYIFKVYYDMTDKPFNPMKETAPLQVKLILSDSNDILDFKFSGFKVSSQAMDSHWIETPTQIGSDLDLPTDDGRGYPHDFFAFPHTMNCLENTTVIYTLLGGLVDNFVRFSFRASSELDNEFQRHFVAFDGLNRVVRLDSYNMDPNWFTGTVMYHRKILDLRTNRKYIIEPVKDFEATEESDTGEKIFTSLRANKCVTTLLDNPNLAKRRVAQDLQVFLFGGNNFKYLGRARVRGIDADVYEGKIDQMPDWFAQPIIYKDPKLEFKSKKRVDVNRPMTGVVYLSARAQGEKPDLESLKILQFNTYYTDYKVSPAFREHLQVEFNDFVWDLSGSPNDEPTSELFSLGRLCSPNGQAVGRVDIILTSQSSNDATQEGKQTPLYEWLMEPAKRNEALSAGLLDVLDLHAIGVSDLESRLVKSHQNQLSILASFNYLEQPERIFNLNLLGRAKFIGSPQDVINVPADTLNDCLWAVGKEPMFRRILFSPEDSSCTIEIDQSKHQLAEIYEMNESEDSELYSVISAPDPVNSLSKSWLGQKNFQHVEGRSVLLYDPYSFLNKAYDTGNTDVKMRLSKVKFEKMNDLDGSSGTCIPTDSLILNGFTLPLSNNYTKKVGVKRNSRDESGGAASDPISWELCEAACLEDLECQSFSVCTDGGEITCTLSSIKVVSLKVLNQVESMIVKRKLKGDTVKVTADVDDILLTKDFRCEIHNKNYLKLFQNHRKGSLTNLFGLQVSGVTDPSECAAKCFEKSLSAIKDSAGIHKQLKNLVHDMSIRGDNFQAIIAALQEQHHEMLVDFCYSFRYVDSALDGQQLAAVKTLAGESSADSIAFCVLRDEQQPVSHDFDNELESDIYEFDFTSLYEKKFGFKLLGSPIETDEYKAFWDMKMKNDITHEQYDTLREAIADQKNFVYTKNTEPNNCASLCFLQSSGLWPACRSFDVTINNHKSESKSSFCQLNTEILAVGSNEGRTSGQRLQHDTDLIRSIHFEPRFQFVKDITESSYDLGTLNEMKSLLNLSNSSLGKIWILIISVCGVLTGLYLGIYKVPQTVSRLQDSDNLNDQLPMSLGRADWDRSYVKFDH